MIFFGWKVLCSLYGLSVSTLMLASVMVAASIALLVYWFRYACRLILNAKTARDYTRTVAEANELRFIEVQQDLPSARERSHLDSLAKKLDDDYHLLSFLLRHSPALHAGSDRLEQRMLMFHFGVMKAYYVLARHVSESNSRRILQEMVQVVGYFANRVGERSTSSASGR